MNIEEGAAFITNAVKSEQPFFVGKLGTSELDVLIFYITSRQTLHPKPYPLPMITNITRNAGLFPDTEESIDQWAIFMIRSVIPAGDGFAAWNPTPHLAAYESALITKLAPNAKQFPLRSLEPYYITDIEKRWTYMIPNTARVAVISPFSTSIEKQWKKHEAIWQNNPIWGHNPPTIIPIRSGYSPSLTTTNGKWSDAILSRGWHNAVNHTVQLVREANATIAIVGCGALSLPICHSLKKAGISAIHTGGATQILFGIKGRRWLNHGTISTFFNEAWEFPEAQEIPSNARQIEGGCYW